MKDENDNKKYKRISFEDQISLVLFACYATEPFSVSDIQEGVLDCHRSTLYSLVRELVKTNYLERVGVSYYKATQYAKDIMNVKGGSYSMTTHYIEQCIEDDGTNSYTDIRNHLSPSTIVIEENLQEQFLEYKPLAECDFEYVSIADLRAAIADHDRTDHCSDIKNHISPTTKVIEQ